METPSLRQSFVAFGLLTNILGHGCLHGYPAVLIAQFRDEKGMKLTASDTSWIGSVLGMSKIFGTLLSLFIMSRFGRQKAYLASTLPAFLGWMVYFCFHTVPFFIVARIFHGLSVGLKVSSFGILMAEYTDPVLRGRFLGSTSVFVASGILLSHVLSATLTWKMTALVCSLIPLASSVILMLSPESPSWLASKGRTEEARKTFFWLRGEGVRQQAEFEEILESADRSMNGQKKSWFETAKIFRQKEFYQPTIVAMCIYLIVEFGGNHVVPSYGNLILQQLLNKEDPHEVRWHLTAIDSLRLISNFIAIFLLKYLKRRTIIFTSGISTCFFLSSMSFFIYFRRVNMIPSDLLEALPLTLVSLYVLSFNLGILPMVWVIVGEVFPLAYRGLGSTSAASVLTPSSIIALKTAPLLFSSVGIEGAFLVYSAVCALCLGIMFPLLPETKDKTLQEIEDSFLGKKESDREVRVELIGGSVKS